jgi:non-canonical (house-cleaning) NTP pyrophosphatase
MKTLFRNLTVTAFCFVASVFTASADNNKPIAFEQLPQQAQQFVKTHFADVKVTLSTVESGLIEKTYDVALNNGTKLEFDRKGQWTEVVCPTTYVPNKVLPNEIKAYLETTFPQSKVTKIEREDGRHEVTLENGTEVTFNKKFQVTDVDL